MISNKENGMDSEEPSTNEFSSTIHSYHPYTPMYVTLPNGEVVPLTTSPIKLVTRYTGR